MTPIFSHRWVLATAILASAASGTQALTSPSLRISSAEAGDVDAQNHRSLTEEGVITQLESGERVHIVTLAQTRIGTCDEATQESTDTADVFMATWLDPDTLEETCGFKKWGVNACFKKTVAIGCDPATNTATVNVYVKDAATYAPAWKFVVDNPLIGKCKFGTSPQANKIVHITEIFDCSPPVDHNPGLPDGPCESDADCTAGGQICNTAIPPDFGGPRCEDEFAAIGAFCGGGNAAPWVRVPECVPEAVCGGSSKLSCTGLTDIPSSCLAASGTCSSNDDCDSALEYCYNSRCIVKREADECCSSQDPCQAGLVCGDQFGFGFDTCFVDAPFLP